MHCTACVAAVKARPRRLLLCDVYEDARALGSRLTPAEDEEAPTAATIEHCSCAGTAVCRSAVSGVERVFKGCRDAQMLLGASARGAQRASMGAGPSLVRESEWAQRPKPSLPPFATQPSGQGSVAGTTTFLTPGEPYVSSILSPRRMRCSIAETSLRLRPPPREGWRN